MSSSSGDESFVPSVNCVDMLLKNTKHELLVALQGSQSVIRIPHLGTFNLEIHSILVEILQRRPTDGLILPSIFVVSKSS